MRWYLDMFVTPVFCAALIAGQSLWGSKWCAATEEKPRKTHRQYLDCLTLPPAEYARLYGEEE